MYKGCRNCNAKVANTGTVCAKCNTKMKLARCANESVANVLLEDTDGKENWVTIFNVLEKIVAVCEATDEADIGDKLLAAPTLTHNKPTKILCYHSPHLKYGPDLNNYMIVCWH